MTDRTRANITIRSCVKTEDGWEETSVFSYMGVVREVNSSIRILFEATDDETTDKNGGVTRTLITARENCLEVARHGAVESTLLFDPGRITESRFRTEYGTISFWIRTCEYSQAWDGGKMNIHLRYDLLQDGSVLLRKEGSRDEGELSRNEALQDESIRSRRDVLRERDGSILSDYDVLRELDRSVLSENRVEIKIRPSGQLP